MYKKFSELIVEYEIKGINRAFEKLNSEKKIRGYLWYTSNYTGNLPEEEWKGKVSNFGRVSGKFGITVGSFTTKYRIFSSEQVHIMVAKKFLGDKPNDDSQVDHINGNCQDNRVSNLRWLSPKENSYHGNKSKKKVIGQFTLKGKLVDIFAGASDAARFTKIPEASINTAVTTKGEGYGFRWKRLDPSEYEGKEVKEFAIRKFPSGNVGIIQKDLKGKVVKRYKNIEKAVEKTGIGRASIVRVCRGTRPTTYGFIFEYDMPPPVIES